ncbi:TRAF2 and NCK-interacting kinase isoform X4 [Pelobates cultripes]|uniref:TRAF2 and NCK-interacting kinase isoform X4 n=1 Tax=Pelobates cultripes TaxID=61616 RepID=A0AAD1VPQ8_PELCU|nr:TRAF2 and NCK-interacting kinase isoform X4 [Pelobates cultripes]
MLYNSKLIANAIQSYLESPLCLSCNSPLCPAVWELQQNLQAARDTEGRTGFVSARSPAVPSATYGSEDLPLPGGKGREKSPSSYHSHPCLSTPTNSYQSSLCLPSHSPIMPNNLSSPQPPITSYLHPSLLSEQTGNNKPEGSPLLPHEVSNTKPEENRDATRPSRPASYKKAIDEDLTALAKELRELRIEETNRPIKKVTDYSSSSEESETSEEEDGEAENQDGTVSVSDIPRLM